MSTYGQDIYIGKIFEKGTPQFSPDSPPVPCPILWLETTSGNYILSIDSHWIICGDELIVDGIEYNVDDEVEITGTISSSGIDIYSVEHFTLEIESIKKLTSPILTLNIDSMFFSNNKIYFDEIRQVIVIDVIFQNQSLTFELVDMQGKVILKKTCIGNNNSISAANLPRGVYIYRLTKEKLVIYSGKILKNN